MIRYGTITDKVRKILSEDEKARNYDCYLILKYIREVDKIDLSLPLESISPNEFMRMTYPLSIVRARRKVQNEEDLYTPTDMRIFSRREKHEKRGRCRKERNKEKGA